MLKGTKEDRGKIGVTHSGDEGVDIWDGSGWPPVTSNDTEAFWPGSGKDKDDKGDEDEKKRKERERTPKEGGKQCGRRAVVKEWGYCWCRRCSRTASVDR